VQNNGQIDTLALDAEGILWKEDVSRNPNVLSIALTGILSGSFADSCTANDQEYILFSDLSVGTERPRVYNGTEFLPLSQVGPGAPPAFQSSVGSAGTALVITHYSLSGNVVTFTYTGTEPTPGSTYLIANVVSYLNGQVVTVLSTGLSATIFEAAFVHANDAGGAVSGSATPTYSYSITSITQPGSTTANGQILLWSAGPGQTAPGSTITYYYGSAGASQNAALKAAFQSGQPVYVYISGSVFGNGVQLVTSIGRGIPPTQGQQVCYLTFAAASSAYQIVSGGNTGTFQLTMATLTSSTPIPNLSQGDSLTISGASPSSWNANWTVVQPLNSGVLNITATAMSASGLATYTFSVQSGSAPVNGQLVLVSDCTNATIFNAIGVVIYSGGSTFQINGFSVTAAIPAAVESTGVAVTYGTQFTFDPGVSITSPIFGNAGASGVVTIVGGNLQPIGAGVRQAVCFFITESGYETTPSPPVVFTTSSDANFINVSKIPIGPPNVIARAIAFTEAGQNGVPGANFYTIMDPVTITLNSQIITYSSTVIRDNVTTEAKFSFTDTVLLNSTPIDVQGHNLFNLIELGSSAWCVPYSSRMFYGLQLNKVMNFLNTTFDGGYLPNPGGNIEPLGWTTADNFGTLITSSVTGQAFYIQSTSAGVSSQVGLISQPAYQDVYQVPIIRPNTLYSVRVAASCPSGINVGTLTIDLTDYNTPIGFGKTYGSFTVPLSDMTSNFAVFSGTLLVTPFTTAVSPNLTLRVYVADMGQLSDVTIERLEVYPTLAPFLLSQVYGSYLNSLESIDASGGGGIIDTSAENNQPCMGGFVMHDNLYLLKTNSLYSTKDNPNSEPGGWSLNEVSNRVGAIGIHSYDVGEEWLVTACRSGIYGFNGGQPVKLMQELWNLWEAINWEAGNTIVLRNDIVNKRILCAIPLPTGVGTESLKWLPNAPNVPAPTSPTVILMLNYQGLGDFQELVSEPEVSNTMFGTLAARDMKRKWSVWQIPTPYLGFITREDEESQPLFICNGIGSEKIYQLLDDQLSDDGVAINGLYCSYGFVNSEKAATVPIFGYHTKRYSVLQLNVNGAGTARVRVIPNTLDARYPYTIPGGLTLHDPIMDDFYRPLNMKGQRAYIEISTDAVGSWFNWSRALLTGKADSWSSLDPTGGGNQGVV
jgi:hypothetical protein